MLVNFPGHTEFRLQTNLSSRPERTQISYLAPLATPTYAAFCRERRMKSSNATKLNRKSGERSGEPAPGPPWERHRRGTHLVLNQSAAWRNRGFVSSKKGRSSKTGLAGTTLFPAHPPVHEGLGTARAA